MSLKCSVLGHRFDEASVERSREESGNEVVITEQEIRTCIRCGHRRVVSENKEVTTLEPADEPADADPTAVTADATAPPADDAGIEADPSPVEEAESARVGEAGAVGDGSSAPEADDGIILEGDDATAPDRDPGAWPEESNDDGPEWTPPDLREEPAEKSELTVEPTGEAITIPEGVFRCGSCGFTTPVESSSLREGDFCPECHTGALAHERGTD